MPFRNWLAALLLLFVPATLSAQIKAIPLDPVYHDQPVAPGQSVIYGNFIQRLGFSSGGFAQDVLLKNTSTGQIYSMRVKGAYKSRKENFFCVHLPAGNYELMAYYWVQSKWYGATEHVEQITKNLGFGQLEKLEKEGRLTEAELQRYRISLQPDVLHYTGTWHFDTPTVSFTDDQQKLNDKIKSYYKKLDFSLAVTMLPQ